MIIKQGKPKQSNMEEIVHLRIKKQYAVALIEDLIKAKALEQVEEPVNQVPEWQKEAVRQTLSRVQEHPEQLENWEIIKQRYKKP
jgi:hypothetical protein